MRLRLEEKRQIFEEYKVRPVTASEFAKTKGVSVTSLYKWNHAFDKEKGNGFIDITKNINTPPSPTILLECNDIQIHVDDDYDERLLLKVLSTLKKL